MSSTALTISALLNGTDARRLAIADTARVGLTYLELQELVDRTHRALASNGLTHRDTVAVALPNSPETAALLVALLTFCRLAPVNPASTKHELVFALRDVGASAIITSADAPHASQAADESGVRRLVLEPSTAGKRGTFELTGDLSPEREPGSSPSPGPDDVALLLHTSGTTARPKLVPLTQRNLALGAQAVAESLELGSTDTCLSIMPLFHVHGLIAGLLASLASSATVCCAPPFRATSFFRWLDASQATWYTAAPSLHQAILARGEHNADVVSRHCLRFIRSCSSTLYTSTWQKLQSLFSVPVLNAYGMTEAAHQISSVRLSGASPTSVGRSSGLEVGVMDPHGRLLQLGQAGEVVLRGPQLMSGYIEPGGANTTAIRDDWFRTGDEGVLLTDGSLSLRGRLKELINCGGEKVSPYEVEEALLLHASVDQAVSFMLPNELLGEVVAAAIVVRAGCQIQKRDLLLSTRQHLAPHKVPREIFFVNDFPRGAGGKIQRSALAQQLGRGYTS